jgi:glyoxylase-like metal-dependent hydrolase (beta-lactamase superfamily II)
MADVKVISIGSLAANPMWGEKSAMRTGHATTTLIRAEGANILVDPGLPGAAIAARLAERANLTPEAITHVFLTSFHPDVRRGLGAFSKAQWLLSEREREALGVPLATRLRDEMERENADQELIAMLKVDVELLSRCQPAPDSLADGVDLFPLPGVTPGMCGLLVPDLRHTTLITGDAIVTQEHLERGVMTTGAIDIAAAQESFKEAIEIADLLVLGRDNMVVNPTKRLF